MNLDNVVKACGFNGIADFNACVSNVDLSSPVKVAAFKRWQEEDGTKLGLLGLGTAPWRGLEIKGDQC